MNDISHDQITDLLGRLDSTLNASELHGLLCGMLCSSPSARAKARWFSELLDSTGLAAENFGQHASDLKSLEQLFDAAVNELNTADLTFQLLLPADNEPIADRTESLALWCSGFVAGIGLGTGKKSDSKINYPDDTQELLRDFAAISKAVPEDNDDDSDEGALLELQEYVRMGTLLINEEITPAVKLPQQVH